MTNREKLARIEARADIANAAVCALSEAYRERLGLASRLRAAAVANAPAVAHLPLVSLKHLDAEHLASAGVDAAALREANAEMAAAREIKTQIDATRAATACMNALVANLRQYANNQVTFGG